MFYRQLANAVLANTVATAIQRDTEFMYMSTSSRMTHTEARSPTLGSLTWKDLLSLL